MTTGNRSNHSYTGAKLWKGAGVALCLTLAFALGWQLRPAESTVRHAYPQPLPVVYFSPRGGVKQALIENIAQARREVLVALYYFTDPDLADALIQIARNGVQVRVMLDKSQKKGRHSQAKRLMDAGIHLVFDTRHRIFHHKFVVIDAATVITGSQNWTKSAESVNAENVLIFKNNQELAHQFKTQFLLLCGKIRT